MVPSEKVTSAKDFLEEFPLTADKVLLDAALTEHP